MLKCLLHATFMEAHSVINLKARPVPTVAEPLPALLLDFFITFTFSILSFNKEALTGWCEF